MYEKIQISVAKRFGKCDCCYKENQLVAITLPIYKNRDGQKVTMHYQTLLFCSDCWNKIKDKVEDLSKNGRNNKRNNQLH